MPGIPLPGYSIKLVNWEEGNYRVTDGPYPRGEIHINGPNVAVGYFKQSGTVNEDFYVDEDGSRWFRSGDIGEFNEYGQLRVLLWLIMYCLLRELFKTIHLKL